MSFDRIAKILCVDEVRVNHGPKGVAVHVRLGGVWRSAAIDNADLVKSRGPDDHRSEASRRLEVIAEHLAFVADATVGKMRDLRKSQADAATRAALYAEQEARRRPSLDDALSTYYGNDRVVQQQVTMEAPPSLVPAPPAADGPAAETMKSRFHAIVAELRCM